MAALHALLLTDVVDSTKLTEELGDAAMAQLWIAHDRIARDLLPQWRGREIDKTDGMLLLFDDVRDAVGYALAYHRGLAARALPFKARAGIHVGPVSLRPNPPDDVARGAKPVEVDGLALPIAARVMSVALGAQTLLSADARIALGVAPQRVVSHGHWRMHGVADPVELFEIGEVGDAGDAPFQAPPDGPKVYRVMRQGDLWQPVREVRHSVPAERDSFVGRHAPLQLLAKKFEAGARLVSVLGMGGTGKTRLVTRFAWTWLGDYPGGVWFCDLSQARTLDGIHFAVAQGLDVPLGKADPVVQLAHAIAGRGRCLVILDNFEQVARHAEATLGHWLDRAPLAQFIVTTREVLGIVGEEMLALDTLDHHEATSLFIRRVESARTGYHPSEEDRRAIDQLVRVLDGLPLAIELAAARVRVMNPRMLLARMHERFRVLLSSGGRRDRQSTLRAAFDWSWELLSEPERAALAQLSVFAGAFTLGAAEAVVDVSQWTDPPLAVDLVEWLVGKSFVRRLEGDRLDLLQSVREYAAQHLVSESSFAGSGRLAQLAAEARHGVFFATRRVLFSAALDIENLIAACQRAAPRGDGSTAMATFEAAWETLELRGPFRVVLDLADVVRRTKGLAPGAAARLDQIAGRAHILAGRPEDARKLLVSARDAAQAHGDVICEARSLASLAELDTQAGQLDLARDGYEAALVRAREHGEAKLQCAVLNGLGTVHERLAQFDVSRSRYEAALAKAREIGNRRWEGGTLGNLGQFHANRGESDRALTLFEEALAIVGTLNDRQWQGNILCNAGLLNHAQGNMERASLQLGSALRIARELGYSFLEAVVLCNLGIVNEAVGRASLALNSYEAALEIARARNDHRLQGQVMGYLGLLNVREGRIDAGRTLLTDGASILRSQTDRVSLGVLLCALAQAEFLTARREAGFAALEEATRIAAETDSGPQSELGVALRHAGQSLEPVDSADSRRSGTP
jgi:predicted ATPase/class 3 adenylate cyclase